MEAHGCFRRLAPRLRQHLANSGRRSPTPVQERAIPGLLRGRSMLIAAGEGSGKTLAWLLAVTHTLERSQGSDPASAGILPVGHGDKVSPSPPSFPGNETRSRAMPSALRRGEASGPTRSRRDASPKSDAGGRGSVCVVLAPSASHLLNIRKEVLPLLDSSSCFPISVISSALKPGVDSGPKEDEHFLQRDSRPRLLLAEPSALLRLLKKASLPKGKRAVERHRAGYRPSREEAQRSDARRELLRSVRHVVVEDVDEIARQEQLDDVRGVLTAICQPIKAARITPFQFVVTASSVTAEAERMMCTFVPSMKFDLMTAAAPSATAAAAAPAATTAAAEADSKGACA